MDGKILRSSDSEKDLGSIISSDLSLSPNTKRLVSLARGREGVLFRALGRLDRISFPRIFRMFIRPFLEINIQAVSPFLTRDTTSLEGVQRRATKRVRGLSTLSYPERLEQLNLFPLEYRRLRGDLILLFKIMHNSSHPLKGLVHPSHTGQLRGHDMKLTCQGSRINSRKYAFAVRVCAPWNALPAEVVMSDNVDIFKRRLDSLMLEGAPPFKDISDKYAITPT